MSTLNVVSLQTTLIEHTNGTDALVIDSVGRAIRPNNPCIILDGNSPNWTPFAVADQTSILTSTYYYQNYLSGGIVWNSTSGLVTVPVTGIYRVCGQIYCAGATQPPITNGADRGRLYVMRNSSLMFLVHTYIAYEPGTIFYTGLVSMTANDHFKLTVSDTVVMYMGGVHTRFCVELV